MKLPIQHKQWTEKKQTFIFFASKLKFKAGISLSSVLDCCSCTCFILKYACLTFAEDLRGEIIVPASKKLEDLIHLSELCVDLLQQNEEHYGEVSFYFPAFQGTSSIILLSTIIHLKIIYSYVCIYRATLCVLS